jgi:hypothetical protein
MPLQDGFFYEDPESAILLLHGADIFDKWFAKDKLLATVNANFWDRACTRPKNHTKNAHDMNTLCTENQERQKICILVACPSIEPWETPPMNAGIGLCGSKAETGQKGTHVSYESLLMESSCMYREMVQLNVTQIS